MQTLANRRVDIPRKLLETYIRQAGEEMARRQTDVGARIREARDAKGWKQKQLAAAVHVEPVTVSRWETGANAPDLATLELIANALNCTITQLVATQQPAPEDVSPDRLATLEAQVGELQVQVAALAAAVTEALRHLPDGDPAPVQVPAASARRRAAR